MVCYSASAWGVHYFHHHVTDWNLLFPEEFTGHVYNADMSYMQEPIGKCARRGVLALRFKVYRASARECGDGSPQGGPGFQMHGAR